MTRSTLLATQVQFNWYDFDFDLVVRFVAPLHGRFQHGRLPGTVSSKRNSAGFGDRSIRHDGQLNDYPSFAKLGHTRRLWCRTVHKFRIDTPAFRRLP